MNTRSRRGTRRADTAGAAASPTCWPAAQAWRLVYQFTGHEIRLDSARAFLMGSPKKEPDEGYQGADETQHEVTLTNGFHLGIYQRNAAQWQAVMGSNPSHFKGDYLPVEQISWDDAVDFCEASKKYGKAYRLPTEAEWEYACRAGTTRPFHFGANLSTNQANYDGNYTYGNGKKGVYRRKTTPVGSFPPERLGVV